VECCESDAFDLAKDGYVDALRGLLAANGNEYLLSKRDRHGFALISWATIRGNLDIVQLLLELGCDKNQPTSARETPLYLAARWGRSHIVECLLQAGASVDSLDGSGDCIPLHIAIRNMHTVIVEQLLKAGANVQQTNNVGENAVYFAHKCSSPLIQSAILIQVRARKKERKKERKRRN